MYIYSVFSENWGLIAFGGFSGYFKLKISPNANFGANSKQFSGKIVWKIYVILLLWFRQNLGLVELRLLHLVQKKWQFSEYNLGI